MGRRLIILAGPTAVGKTDYSIGLALKCGSPIISCDSRQIYGEMSIGTAVPDASQLAAVKHYFIQSGTVHKPYTAGSYAQEALSLINSLFEQGHDTLIMAGGSGFYVQALTEGLDNLPDGDPDLRERLLEREREEGLGSLRMELQRLDPEAYATIDLANGRRVIRALEVCLISGRPFSSFHGGQYRHDFEIEKYCLVRPREELFARIGKRVDQMMAQGLLEEVRSLLPLRNLPALQTVGYRELFSHLDGNIPLDLAVEQIKTNTRRYAKKQLTWWKRDPSVKYVSL